MAATPSTAPWEVRLDRLAVLVASRKVSKSSDTHNAMIGVLSGLVDDATWSEALARVEQVTT